MKQIAAATMLALVSISTMAASTDVETKAPTYTGKCEVMFDTNTTQAEVSVLPDTTASICVPAGWKIYEIANLNRTPMDWKIAFSSIKNVALIQPKDAKAKLAKWWIYPVDEKGDSPMRFELTTKAK